MKALLFVAATLARAHAATIAADSDLGAQVFETLHCIECHSINGKGGTAGPDLGRRMDRDFTPASLAATMWNHAPAMWAAMSQRRLGPGDLNDQSANNLFAFFYAARFFDKPGDAWRGKALFIARHCSECHGITQAKIPAAKPVAQWESIGHPIVLVNAMWNHGAMMREEFARRKLSWPQLTSQELADMLVYLRNVPAARRATSHVMISSGENGRALFESKGCTGCHGGKLALPPRLKKKTLTDIAVAMWNHEPRMATAPAPLTIEEMREIVSYLWAEQFFADAGNPVLGKRVFTSKHCAACHEEGYSHAPKLPSAGQSFSSAKMVTALWHHGPIMLAEMHRRNLAWPRFDAREMSSLIAYLNTNKGGK